LRAVPITIKRANEYVALWHRHHGKSAHHLFAVAVAREGESEPCGVAIIGPPAARLFDTTGMSAEIRRMATDGTPNANSKLYSIARSVCQKLGYRQLATYTLPSEGGASLRAVGAPAPVEAGGGSWSRKGRVREDKGPLGRKWRTTEQLQGEQR
jgi:hypothetical protein